MKTTMKLEGFRELERALAEDMTKGVARNVLKRAGVNALKPMQAKARALAPADSGALRASIIIKPGFDPAFNAAAYDAFKQFGTARGVRRKKGFVSIGLGVSAKRRKHPKSGKPTGLHAYAQYQEFGTIYIPGTPYMRPAADAEGERTLTRVRDELKMEIGKAKDRIAKRAARKKAKG